MTISRVTLLVLVLGLTPACDSGGDGGGAGGGGGGGGGGAANIEIGEDSAPFTSFNETQAQEICESIGEQMAKAYDVDDAMHGSCLLGGLLAKALMGGDAQICQTSYDACMDDPGGENPDPQDPEEPEDDCADIYEKVKDCDATIGELEACLEAQVEAQQAFFDALGEFDCDSAMEDFEAIQGQDGEEPAACTTLYEKCPALNE